MLTKKVLDTFYLPDRQDVYSAFYDARLVLSKLRRELLLFFNVFVLVGVFVI